MRRHYRTKPPTRYKRISAATQKLKRPIPRTVVPSFFTLMNILCGFLAIIHVSQDQLVIAAWLILLAGFFDAIDGLMARLANATSEFGTQLDSLCDIVSFGVAPGFLVYTFALHEFNMIGMILASLPPVCGAVRLARFNVLAEEGAASDEFKGLPIPAQAGLLVAFVLAFRDSPELFEGFRYGMFSVLIPTIIVLSLLMVSTIPFDKMPRFNKEYLKRHPRRVLLFAIYGLAILVFREFGFFAVFTFFILKGLLTGIIRIVRLINDPEFIEST